MRYLSFLAFLWCCPSPLNAQLHDNTWLLGYQSGPPEPGDSYGIVTLSFPDGNAQATENQTTLLSFRDNNSAFSDAGGNLLAYCNGLQIENAAFQIMENGQALDQEIVQFYQYWSDDDPPQGSLFLPWPGHPDSVLLIYSGDFYVPAPGYGTMNRNLSYAVIDRQANGGLGKVVAREQPILEDTVAYGQVTATRHANGRDWWIMTPERNADRFYRILIDPGGVHVVGQQTVDEPVFMGLGQSCFSPDGRYFAAYNAVSAAAGAWLDVFDFDRCDGVLSNQRHLSYAPGEGRIGGVAISPNSRYLYHNFYDTVYQYDLQAANFAASQTVVAVRDPAEPFPFRFYQSQLAPDGKIYTSATNAMKALHVIHRPDEAGDACRYQQRGLVLPTLNAQSVANFPNYRLGPLDGSPCDTLGLDNVPAAWWRYEQDTLNPARFDFRDLSHHEPAVWTWDFGDGTGSAGQHPIHEYAAPGAYFVCLTVSNDHGADTHCKTVQITVSAPQPGWAAAVRVGPSPFRERLLVGLDAALPSPVFRLYDALGRLHIAQPLAGGLNELDTAALPAGVYFWEMTVERVRATSGKIIRAPN